MCCFITNACKGEIVRIIVISIEIKSKKKKGDTIFIIEKKVSNDNMQPAMANTGRRGLNNLGEFDNSNETLVKLQSTSLKYT